MTSTALISVTNTHTHTGIFPNTSSISFGRLSIVIPKKKKNSNRRSVFVRAQSSSVAGLDVEFEPSFADYLEAMESVKTVREKRNQARTGAETGRFEDSEEPDEGNNGESTRNLVPNVSSKVNERIIVYDKENSNSRGFIQDEPPRVNKGKIVYGRNGKWEREKGNLGEEDDRYGRFNRNPVGDRSRKMNRRDTVYGKNERWEREEGNLGKEDSRHGGFIRNSFGDQSHKINERDIVHGKNERWEREKGNLREEDSKYRGFARNPIGDQHSKINERDVVYGKNVRWEKNKGRIAVEGKINRGSILNPIQYELKSTKRFDMYDTNGRWEENKHNSAFVKEKDYNFKVDGDRIQGSEMVVKTSRRYDMYDQNGTWEENQDKSYSAKEKYRSFRADKDRTRGTKMVSGNEKLLVNSVTDRRRNRAVDEESDNDEEFRFERAAFKPVGGLDEIVDKPRITRNEMEDRIQKLARCLNGADVNIPEWMFSKMMRSARIRFSDHTILRIIQFLGKLGNWKRVLQLIDWLQSRERFQSHKLRHIYTAALGVLGKARRPVEALNLFQTMQQQISTYPDLVAYHSIAVTLGQAGHMRELFEVIDIMKSPPKKKFKNGTLDKWDPRLEPDIVVYHAILNACVRRKQWEGAFWVLQQLKEKGQPPSGTTYGLVMEVMLACEKYSLVHDFYKKVLKSSIPNALTYKVLVNTLWREGKTDEAVSAVEDMERRGVVGSAALYYDLARCLCSAGRCQEALIQVDKICRVANKPLVVTYTGLMQACLDAGNIENADYIFKHMHKFCSPNLITCNIMLKAYIEHGKFEEAKSLFNKLLEDGNRVSSRADYRDRVIPDKYTFNTMLDACVEGQKWDEFEVAFKGMLEYGYPFNAKRHLRMILDAGRAGKGELVEATWNHLIQNDQISPPHSLMKEMLCVKLEKGDYTTALSYISNHNQSNSQPFSYNGWLRFFDENAHRLTKDSLVELVHEAEIFVSRSSDDQRPVLQNLILACREFLNTRPSVSRTDNVDAQIVLC